MNPKPGRRAADPEAIVSSIFLALARRKYDAAAELAERHWGILSGEHLPVLRAVADSLPPDVLDRRPSWVRMRRYLGFLLIDRAVRPSAFIDPGDSRESRSLLDGLIGLTMQAISARTSGRVREAVRIARSALVLVGDAEPAELTAIEHRTAEGYLQWGLCFEFAGIEGESLSCFETAYDFGRASGNTRAACDAAGQLAWLHALCGRGPTADEWIARAKSLLPRSRAAETWRRGEVLAEAVRAADQLRPDLALRFLAERPIEGPDEHRRVALAQSAIFRAAIGADSAIELLSELRQARFVDADLLAEPGENTIVLGYAEAVVEAYGGHPDRALELLDSAAAGVGEPYVIGMRALLRHAAGDDAAALADAATVLERYGQWPRLLVPAALVRALAALRAGDPATAATEFVVACRIAAESGIVSTILAITYSEFTDLLVTTGSAVIPESIRQLSYSPEWFAPQTRA